MRYDDYEGVGNKTTPKVGLRYQPNRTSCCARRAGKGFRAPSLLDLYAAADDRRDAGRPERPDRCPITDSALDCVDAVPDHQRRQHRTCKPEKSKNFTVGIVLEPTNNVSFGIDYFNVKLEETISTAFRPATILSRHDAVRRPR